MIYIAGFVLNSFGSIVFCLKLCQVQLTELVNTLVLC